MGCCEPVSGGGAANLGRTTWNLSGIVNLEGASREGSNRAAARGHRTKLRLDLRSPFSLGGLLRVSSCPWNLSSFQEH